MKKTFITLIAGMLLTVPAFAFFGKGDKTISDRLEKPLIVVLDDADPYYNEHVKYAVENYWSANTYTFLTESQFEESKAYSENLFLIKNEKQAAEDIGTTVYDNVMKLVYFRKDGKLVASVAGTPLIQEGTEDLKTTVINAVRVLQDKLQFAIFKEEKEVAEFAKNYDKNVESRSTIVKATKLYIAKEDIDASTNVDEIRALYDGEMYIVTREELEKMIDSKGEDIVYAVVFNKKTSNVTYINSKQVVSASTGEVIYADETTSVTPKGFTKKDIKDLAE
ncbi:MAG: hypothetical protein ACKVPJ_11720 [Chitinophagales bacterium]